MSKLQAINIQKPIMWFASRGRAIGFVLYLLSAFSMPATAQAFVNVSGNNDIFLGKQCSYFLEGDTLLTKEEAFKQKKQARSLTKNTINFGPTDKAYWYICPVKNSAEKNIERIFTAGWSTLRFQAFLYNETKTRWKDLKKLNYRNWQAHYSVKLEKNSQNFIVFRAINTPGSVHLIHPALYSEISFHQKRVQHHTLSFLYYGAMLIMILYNFFLFISIKKSVYGYYLLMIFFFVMTFLTLDGIGAQYLWSIDINSKLANLFGSIVFIFMGLFIRKLLEVEKFMPVWNKIITGAIYGFLVIALLYLIIPLRYATIISSLTSTLWPIFLFFTGLRARKYIPRTANIYLIGWSIYLATIIGHGFLISGIIWFDHSLINHMYWVKSGSIIEVTMFSIALADRINILSQEKQRAQKTAIENLQKSVELKNDFLANTSHELRTPLQAVIGLTDTVLDEPGLSDTVHQNLNTVKTSAMRLNLLISDLLDLSQIESGVLELKKQRFHVSALINHVAALNKTKAAKKKLELKTDITIEKDIVFADENRIFQVLQNLVDNSIKYTEKGSVTVSAYTDIETPDHIIIAVTDTGIGIEENDVEKVFESFMRGSSERIKKIEGLGIGLAVCHRLLSLHNSSLIVKSKPQQGSLFYFSLPVAEELERSEIFADETMKKLPDSNTEIEAPDLINPGPNF